MKRRQIATIANLVFAAFWAVRASLAIAGKTVGGNAALWLLSALFVVVAIGVAAGGRWARWLGLIAAGAVGILLLIGVSIGYVFSLFGDQAMDLGMAFPYLLGIGCAAAIVTLLAKRLDH